MSSRGENDRGNENFAAILSNPMLARSLLRLASPRRISGAYNQMVEGAREKMMEFGIPLSELGFEHVKATNLVM